MVAALRAHLVPDFAAIYELANVAAVHHKMVDCLTVEVGGGLLAADFADDACST